MTRDAECGYGATDRRRNGHGGFTITEILVVVSIIAVLMAVLLPSLAALRGTGDMTVSMSRMKQIGQWMTMYSTDNNEFILPSQFDYSGDQFTYKGKVRATVDPFPPHGPVEPVLGQRNAGTWADILWTLNGLGPLTTDGDPPHDYTRDSPDAFAYEFNPGLDNPLRSAGSNTRNFGPGDGVATPYGSGAQAGSEPGFFAANNCFNQTPASKTDLGAFWTHNQIERPADTMYLVDSVAGETIEPVLAPYDNDFSDGNEATTLEVDFRYNTNCLMLFLDSSVRSVGSWNDLPNLENDRKIVIRSVACTDDDE